MKLNKLSLKNQSLFARYLDHVPRELAAFSFANIYIWQALYEINWALIENALCVFFRDPLGCFMYLPPLAKEPVSSKVLAQAFRLMEKINRNSGVSRIENIPQTDSALYRQAGYTVREKYPDYLCLRKELELLSGNDFKSQRAACNYFVKHCDHACAMLTPAARADCLALFTLWAKERKAAHPDTVYCGMLEDSFKTLQVALDNYRSLHFSGIVVKVNKKIRGFSFGYELNAHTFCVLYEVTDLKIKGLAQYIFREFSRKLPGYKYINIMDDSGIKSLAQTKLAYRPLRLVRAYIATLS